MWQLAPDQRSEPSDDPYLRDVDSYNGVSLAAERKLLALSSDLSCVCNLAGFFEYLGPSWEQTLGWKVEELKARPLMEFVHPEDRAATKTWFEGLEAGGLEVLPRKFNNRFLCRDDTYSLLAWRATRGKDDMVYASARDVTAEVEAKTSRSLLATIVDSTFDAIISMSLDGIITSWNVAAETMYGWSELEAVGQHVSLIYPDLGELESMILRARSRKVTRMETVRMTRAGVTVDVLATVSPILGVDGEVIGVSSISTNIADRLMAEAEAGRISEALEQRVVLRTRELQERTSELERSMEELDSFAYSVSHDLRAPLRAMDGFSRMALDELSDEVGPEKRHYLEVIRKNAQGMQRLIDGLLDFSRLGRRALEQVRLAPAILARQALADMGEAADRADVDITIDDLPNCMADPTLLKQVFANLLGNALKFTTNVPDARINVGSLNNDGEITYFVRDNGVGFDPRYADKVFGVFQRLHRAEDYEGTGIGLAVVQRVIEKHGGKVWCEGELGSGATFYFTLSQEETSS